MNTVFIADDCQIERLIFETILKKLGYEVVVFTNGKDVSDALYAVNKPVIALLDWLMPEKNGVDVCASLINDPPAQPVYTIVVTSRTNKEDIAFALESGADDFIAKPFHTEELRARINVGIRLLNLRQQLLDSNSHLLEYTKHIESLAEERAVQLVQADRLSTIGLLSAGMAHEINNPASFVAINIQTLEENIDSLGAALKPDASVHDQSRARFFISTIPDILHEMKNGISRIKTIVEGLKTYTHMSSNNFNWFTVEACVESALQLCVNKLKQHVTVKKQYQKTPVVYGNMGQIEQVFINLITNAVDAIELTGKDGYLYISTFSANGKVIVELRDTGPGIPDYKLEKVFMPFFTTKPIGKGTGLGLSISRNIISDHKGELLVNNHPEGGAVFTIVLHTRKEVPV